MSRRNSIPQVLALRSTGWTRFRWLASFPAFKLSTILLVVALAAAAVWSQWSVVQPMVESSVRSVAIAILGEDAVGPTDEEAAQQEAVESMLSPASVKQREKLTSAIGDGEEQIAAVGTTLPETAFVMLNRVSDECNNLILDPSAQSVSVDFCTQEIAAETTAVKTAAETEVARIAAEKKAAEEAAAAEAERQRQAAEEQARQNANNNGGSSNGGSSNNNNGGSSNNNGGGNQPPAPSTRSVTVRCSTGPAVVTIMNGQSATIPAGGSHTFTFTGNNFSFEASGGQCSAG